MKRFLWIILPSTPIQRQFLPKAGFVYREGPKSPFDSVTLADDRETGLFVRPCFPRLTSATGNHD